MSFLTSILFASLLSFSSAAVNEITHLQIRQTTCYDVYVFMARGNGEAYPGRVGAMANAICNGLPSCGSENILFDSNQAYCSQLSDGVSSGINQITAYASACPKSKIIIAGYSLGAHIAGDILGGGGGNFYTCTENSNAGLSIGSSPGSHIAAALLFGDPRHVAYQTYNTGTGSIDNGQYPRSGSQLSDLNEYSGVLQSWCLSTDPICANGDDGLSHETYMTVFADQAAAWTRQKLAGGSSGGSAPVSPTPTPTPTPSITSTPNNSGSGASSSAPVSSGPYSSDSSTSVQTTSTPTTTNPAPSTSFTPFVFSNSATVATTSTFVPSTFKASTTDYSSNLPTSLFSSTTYANTNGTAPTAPVTRASTSSPPVATFSSTGDAYSNAAPVILNLVSLVIIKVLAF